VTLELDMVLEDPASGFCGAVVNWENGLVVLEDRRGKRRSFPIGPGFWLEGSPVKLRTPHRAVTPPGHTASGSLAGPEQPAKVAQPSRLWVEGIHDAELVEKVWGADLRYLGVVVEPLGGVDNLCDAVAEFAPSCERRLGVLVDHLLNPRAGSTDQAASNRAGDRRPDSSVRLTKEDHIAEQVRTGPYAPYVMITGHRFVDIWQAVLPSAVGVAVWPNVDRSMEWKRGICEGLGWPNRTNQDMARAWRRILAGVKSWMDLDRSFVTEVERLIDFVQPTDLE
jgi:hypothetical protein